MPGTPGAQRWFFDTWSRFYDLPLIQRLTYRPVHDAVLEDLLESRPACVLDVGCGTGLLTLRVRTRLGAARVVGCDYSHGMLRQALARAGTLPWIQGDAQRLPFRDGVFDALVSTEAFHWFPDQAAALAEFFRVLVPGGRLLVALVNTPFVSVSDAVYLASRLVGEPLYWPTREGMRVLLERAGFRVVAQRRLYRIPAGLLLPPVLTIAVRPHLPAPTPR